MLHNDQRLAVVDMALEGHSHNYNLFDLEWGMRNCVEAKGGVVVYP